MSKTTGLYLTPSPSNLQFLADTTWSVGLLTIFEACGRENRLTENRYHGPYIKLPTSCFNPNSFKYFIAPQITPSDAGDSIKSVVVFDACRRPVLIANISMADTKD